MQEKVVEKIEELEENIWGSIKEFLDLGIHFGEGGSRIDLTVGVILTLIFVLFVVKYILKYIRKFFTRKMEETDKLKFISAFKFFNYVVYIIVFFVIISMTGINITPFLAASAALLVGLGLALQDLFQDIIGGIFIIFDKSLLVGDVIEVEGKVGKVLEIKLRTTRAITRDDKIIIIPNHILIRNSIYNYTQNRKTTREHVAVGVAYGSDTNKVKELLLESLSKEISVLKKPSPFVTFEDFGDSALLFHLNFYINDSFKVPRLRSEVRFTIDRIFRENNITIPFPQRDLHYYPKSKES